jgi:hypothetical protein
MRNHRGEAPLYVLANVPTSVGPETLDMWDYHKQLLPLYRKMVNMGKIKEAPSQKRADITKAVLSALQRKKRFDPNKDPDMLMARVQACEAELDRMMDARKTISARKVSRATV